MSKSQSTYPLRLPTSVKAEVTRRAKAEGTSFNQFVATAVSEKLSPNGEKKIWKNVESSVALVSEFTLKYDFSPDA